MIAIPNMDKPKSCKECPFTCEALQFFNGTDIPQSCPLFEIVRCGECTEWHEYAMQNPGRNLGGCDCWFMTTGDDDFCSYGERRTDEHTD